MKNPFDCGVKVSVAVAVPPSVRVRVFVFNDPTEPEASERVTGPVKPLMLARVMVDVAVSPGDVIWDAGFAEMR